MAVQHLRYEADGWGVGELVLDDGLLVWHELPRPAAEPGSSSHPLAERMRSALPGPRDRQLVVDEPPALEPELPHAPPRRGVRVALGHVPI